MRYYFDWDQNKAKANRKKHGITFEDASTTFLDPRMISVFDTEHSEHEDRWATIGIDKNGILLVVVHTFQQLAADSCRIRIISARKATRIESKQYKEENK
ncbi:MAG: BrnT family toxin [Nitrospirae bacterium]|nr:BrnT family toxin [Nitrospirota bacterium]